VCKNGNAAPFVQVDTPRLPFGLRLRPIGLRCLLTFAFFRQGESDESSGSHRQSHSFCGIFVYAELAMSLAALLTTRRQSLTVPTARSAKRSVRLSSMNSEHAAGPVGSLLCNGFWSWMRQSSYLTPREDTDTNRRRRVSTIATGLNSEPTASDRDSLFRVLPEALRKRLAYIGWRYF